MMKPLQTPEMDMRNKTQILVFLIIYINRVSGLAIPQPDKLMVKILDGDVIVHWKHPENATSNSQYNVQMAKYNGEWAVVANCTGITKTYCDLSNLIPDYGDAYKVRVQLVAEDDVSAWTPKKFLPNTSELQPPSFTLRATSSTLAVFVHQKHILRKLFPYGLTYTIYLEERGANPKNTTAYLKDDMEEVHRTMTFRSLHWGREYCVSIKVEGNGALSKSNVSHRQCLQLPEQEWFILVVSFFSILGVLAFVAIMVTTFLCYLRRPEKTPAALKSPVSGWLPLSVREGTMEVVTDKGWFLSSYRTEVKKCVKDPVTRVTVKEENEEEDRRTSMDSGVGMETNSAINGGGSPPTRQEDSGCGSMGGPEDSGSLKEVVSGGNYRSQSPSDVQSHVCDEDEEMFKQILPDLVLAEVVTGYRAGPQSCICSGAGQCTWCHKQSPNGAEVIKQYRSMCIDKGLLSNRCDFVDSYKGGLTFSTYSKKTQMDTVTVDDLETTLIQLGVTFPLLTALSPLPLLEEKQDFNMNNVSLSLCDVQLKTD